MSRVKFTNGDQTLVDDTSYDITFEMAALRLLYGEDIIAQPFPDFLSDELDDHCPAGVVLKGTDFIGSTYDAVIEHLRQYENFGKA